MRKLTLLGLLLLGMVIPAAAQAKPNVVVIMLDDWPAMNGRLLQTMPVAKNVFGEQGWTFSLFRSESPLCCPARSGVLTGLYTHHHHVDENRASLLNPGETIATAAKRAGYRTMLIGKYLQSYDQIAARGKPPGWDYFAAFGNPTYLNYDLWIQGAKTHYGTTEAEHSTNVVASLARQQILATPADEPLYAMITPFSPHGPSKPTLKNLGNPLCAKLPKWLPPSFNEADVSDKPLYVRNQPLLTGAKAKGWNAKSVCESLLDADDLVRTVRTALADAGRLDDTLLILMGDNGMMEGEHRFFDKQSPYSIDIPFYMSWPAQWGNQPRTVPDMVMNIDLAPTFCELMGCTMGPYPTGQAVADGQSFASLLTGGSNTIARDVVLTQMPNVKSAGTTPPPRSWAVNSTPLSEAAFSGCAAIGACLWHYVEYETGEVELYDVSGGPCATWTPLRGGDPCELNNRASDPALLAVRSYLHDRLVQLKAS